MIGLIVLGVIVFAVTCAAVVGVCHIRRVRKVEQRVRNKYLYEQMILQQNYLAAYSALLRVAEDQEKKAQNRTWTRQ